MDNRAILLITELYLDEFDKLVEGVSPYNKHDFPETFHRIKKVQAKMIKLCLKWDKSPELLEQIQRVEPIIKKLEQKQNNHVIDM